ncbi:MarR family winged helix-turn-helix transcriptional regulator [Anaerospora hongkongensis]|uniref:MarR family winged helix-turn-helix transcriptional regulator n=1 Tax=Anaerospora hongkongensis TaxID=244830 RepID=UPI00289E1C2D|nr:MarR family transcriptional regulator [Anaerospora hongkongensis]
MIDNKDELNMPSVESLSTSIGRFIMYFNRLERNPHDFGGAGRLTPSEIHVINAIGCGDGILMGKLAGHLGVTKGAVTQIIIRMEVKGFVRRVAHPTDFRSTLVSLTEKGEVAYQAHEELVQNFYRKVSMQLAPQEIKIFKKCMETFCNVFENEF